MSRARRRSRPAEHAPAPRDHRPWHARTFWRVAGMLVLTLVIYWPAVRGEFLWDDPAHVTREELRNWDGLRRIFMQPGDVQQYYPILHGAFWVEYQLWGEAVVPYHLLNIALHATNACLLAWLLRRLWQRTSAEPAAGTAVSTRGVVPPGTEWLAAVLFAVHPVCVETVAWISEQKNTLSMLFYLLAVLTFLRFHENRRKGAYAGATVLFLLGLGSKTMTATLPAALLVVLWWRQGSLAWRRDVAPLVPWFACALAGGLATSWMERHWIGAQGEEYALAAWQRLLLAPRILWFYLGKLLWPAKLTFFYPRWDVPAEAVTWIPYLLAALGVTVALWLLRRRARGPLATWLLYAGTLFPALGFFNIFPFSFSYVADHFQYLALPMILAAVAAGIVVTAGRLPAAARTASRVMVVVVLLVFCSLTLRHSRLYVNDETLFRANVAVNPESWMGHHILGHTLVVKGPAFHAEAETHYRRALELRSPNPESHYKLGMLLARRPETRAEALEHYEEALRIRPEYPEALNSLAFELEVLPGRLPEAIKYYEKAIALRPNFADAHANLGRALARVPGREDQAVEQYQHALRLMPRYAYVHLELANLYATMPGRAAEAIRHYQGAIGLDPENAAAHVNYATFRARQPGGFDEAMRHFQFALRLQPGSAEIHVQLANALALQPGMLDRALLHYERALQLDPNLASAHYYLALQLAKLPERVNDAFAEVEAAIRLQPDHLEARNLLGILHAQAGRRDTAREQWLEALRLNPDYEPARQNLQRLEHSDMR